LKLSELNVDNEAFIFTAMHILANRFQTLGDRIDSEITTKQWFVLAAVSKFTDRTPNIGDIASLLGTSRQNIKKMAVILERRGYLSMQKNEKDLRNILLVLTELCLDYFKGREQQEDEYLQRIFSDFDDEILKMMRVGMGKLIENTDKLLEINEQGEWV